MLKYDIESLEPINVLAVRIVGLYSDCGAAWEKLMKFAYAQKIKNKKNLMGKNARMFGVAYDNPNVVEPSKLRYDACVTKDDDVTLEEGINDLAIGGGKYAVFMHKGAYEALSETYKAIYGELMSAKITLRDAPPFEEYLNRDPRRTKPENLKTRIYIPIA